VNKLGSVVLAAALLPATVLAEAGAGYLDGYYIPLSALTIEQGGSSVDKDGFGYGGRGLLPVGQYLGLTAEDQESKFHAVNSTVRQFRIGGGPALSIDRFHIQTMLLGEYVSTNLRVGGAIIQPDGYGAHLRAAWYPFKGFSVYGQGGYLNLRAGDQSLTLSGPEFTAGVAYVFLGDFGVFADYRYTQLEDSNSNKFELGDLRTGIRWSFGGKSSSDSE
jgi:hypothetical protein